MKCIAKNQNRDLEYFVHAIYKSLEMPLIEWLKFTIHLLFYGCLKIKMMMNEEKKSLQ